MLLQYREMPTTLQPGHLETLAVSGVLLVLNLRGTQPKKSRMRSAAIKTLCDLGSRVDLGYWTYRYRKCRERKRYKRSAAKTQR